MIFGPMYISKIYISKVYMLPIHSHPLYMLGTETDADRTRRNATQEWPAIQ